MYFEEQLISGSKSKGNITEASLFVVFLTGRGKGGGEGVDEEGGISADKTFYIVHLIS